MKPCAVVGLLGSAVILALGCGAGAQQAAPSSPTPGSEPAPASASSGTSAPAGSAAPTSAGSAAPTPADSSTATDASNSGAPTAAADDSRSTAVIAAVVKAHRKEARSCYENALKQVAGLKGDLVIHFTLKPNGAVKTAELNRERSTITEPLVVNCVISVISAIQFPESSKGMETTVNYPFNFNP